MIVEAGKTYIGKIRVTTHERDTLALKVRLSNMLSTIDLHPAGLPCSAIICIRRFRDPLPGALQAHHSSVHTRRVWERAATASLEQLIRNAARPLHDAVPANAEVVIFADQAELLACLASDWCGGNINLHWWWRGMFKEADMAQAVLHAWLAAAAYTPAALQHLSMRSKAVPFVRSLRAGGAGVLLQGITQSFALPELQAALALVLDGSMHRDMSSTSATRQAPAPWEPWVLESTGTALLVEQRCLLGIGLMLRRAPAQVRAPSFIARVKQWCQAALSPVLREEENDIFKTQSPHLSLSPTSGSTSITMRTILLDAHTESTQPMATIRGDSGTRKRSISDAAPEINQSRSISGTDLAPPSDDFVLESHYNDLPATADESEPGTLASRVPIMESLDEASLQEMLIETAYGGIFYLLNFGIALGLYSDFTTPLHTGIPLDIWDFVALLGWQLVGEQLLADPAWKLLAHLAGRNEHELPGKDFIPPGCWRVPVEWLTAFPGDETWQCSRANERLRVYHPGQFFVLDLPLATHPISQLQQEMQAYENSQPGKLCLTELQGNASNTSRMPGLSPQLECWLGWLIPYVRARLCRALSLTGTEGLASCICQHQAHIVVTATHLDIYLRLDELPIEIRLAGLDRNPGWIPAAGRFVAFRFD